MIALSSYAALFQILVIDLSLAGDNAIIVGTAAARLPAKQRRRAILIGIGAATLLRILFALFAVRILHIVGLMVAGGLLLLWVAWKMRRDIHALPQTYGKRTAKASQMALGKTLRQAILQIIIADVSMSLDNVLAVAGVARDHLWMLAVGLILSVALMGAAATGMAKIINRYPRLTYIALAIVVYTSLNLIWDGSQNLLQRFLG